MTNGKNKIKINPDNGLTFTDNNVEKLKLDIATGNVIGNDCTFNNGNFTGTIKSDTNIMGADFYNKKQTVKLTLGMNGNLGDLKLTRTADDTVVFQIYDDITVTSLRRNDIGFISTSGNNTYMLGKWLYKDKEIATQQNIKELEDRIKTLETRLQNLETSSVE